MSASRITYERKGDVVVLTMDDGKMNAFDFTLIKEMHEALDRVEAEAGDVSVLLLGNKKYVT